MSSLSRWTFFLTVMILGLGPAQGQDLSRSQVRGMYENAIVFLQVEAESATGGFNTVSTGTGFIVSEDGYVLTNTHVLAGVPSSVPGRIFATPRSRHSAGDREELRVIDTDKERDIALLQFQDVGKRRSSIVIGDSNDVIVDDEVYAFGFPFDEDLIGATGTITSKTGEKGRWRTDLALNPGNSGGPVFNTQGEVIGIVVSKDPRATLISHVIPINYARDLLEGHGVETIVNIQHPDPPPWRPDDSTEQPDMPSRLADIQTAELRLSNVDDHAQAFVNGNEVVSAHYGDVPQWKRFQQFLETGVNEIRVFVRNGEFGGCGAELEVRINKRKVPGLAKAWAIPLQQASIGGVCVDEGQEFELR